MLRWQARGHSTIDIIREYLRYQLCARIVLVNAYAQPSSQHPVSQTDYGLLQDVEVLFDTSLEAIKSREKDIQGEADRFAQQFL